MSSAPILGYLGGFWLCLVVLASLMALLARRRARSAIIFRHLGIIVQQNLPLSPALQAAAASEAGLTKQILLRLARRSTMGIPLSQAIATGYPNVPALALSVIQAGERTGTLPDAFRELNERMSRDPEPADGGAARRWLLSSTILMALTSVYLTACFFVFPRCVNIFADFGIEGQRSTFLIRELAQAGNPLGPMPPTLAGGVFRALITGLLVATPLFLVCGLSWLRPRNADRVSAISVLRDLVQWCLWPTRRLAWASCCAHALSTLRLTIAAGWPLPEAVERASEIDANHFARRRLRQWAERLRGGDDAIASGRALHLPEMLLAQVAIGLRDGDLDAPLHLAEDYYRHLENRWKAFFLQLLWPLTTLYLGAIVGIVSVVLFQTLTSLIDNLLTCFG